MGTAFWALLTREPAAPHVCSVSLGPWLLVARPVALPVVVLASQNSWTAGLVVVALSA
jgi:hypothetical protein